MQRFYCCACRKTFTRDAFSKGRRHAYGVVSDAVKRVVEDNTSYRQMARRLGVHPTTVLNWVNYFGNHAKSPIEIAQELQPQWHGILGLDGKPIRVAEDEKVLLVAVDVGTHDPFFFYLVDAEDEANVRRFLLIIKEVFQYRVEGIISDLGKGRVFKSLISELFPDVYHQVCVVHFARYIEYAIPKSEKSKYYLQNEFLRDYLKDLLFVNDFNDAEEMFIRLQKIEHMFSAPYHKQAIASLKRHFEHLTAHCFKDGLPRDNNIVENIINNLNKKLIPIRSFRRTENAYAFFKLWFCAYRFRPFSASALPHRNGLSPLNLAGVDTNKMDWLKYSQRQKSNI